MYKIGDKVLYGALGVTEIVDISDQTVGESTKKYYVLKELASPSSSLTYIPLENEELTSQMKTLLTADEVIDVIKTAKSQSDLEWIEDNRARSEMYKKILASGDRVRMLVMMNSIYHTGQRREQEGKKNFIADEGSMKRAEKIIYCEFSLALGIPEDEVQEFIRNL